MQQRGRPTERIEMANWDKVLKYLISEAKPDTLEGYIAQDGSYIGIEYGAHMATAAWALMEHGGDEHRSMYEHMHAAYIEVCSHFGFVRVSEWGGKVSFECFGEPTAKQIEVAAVTAIKHGFNQFTFATQVQVPRERQKYYERRSEKAIGETAVC